MPSPDCERQILETVLQQALGGPDTPLPLIEEGRLLLAGRGSVVFVGGGSREHAVLQVGLSVWAPGSTARTATHCVSLQCALSPA